MGTKYTSTIISGYNATPPPDDGTKTDVNKIKWSHVKTKVGDPVKTLAESMNTKLVDFADTGPVAISANTVLNSSHHAKTIEASGAIDITLPSASAVGSGFYVWIVNTDGTTKTVKRTGADTIGGVAADVTSTVKGQAGRLQANAAANGYLILTTLLFEQSVRYRSEASGENTTASVFTSTTDLVTVNFGTLVNGDRVLVTAYLECTKGASGTQTTGFIAKASGTASIQTFHNKTNIVQDFYHPSGSLGRASITGYVKVTSDGTLTLKFQGSSDGTGATLILAQLWGTVLYNK